MFIPGTQLAITASTEGSAVIIIWEDLTPPQEGSPIIIIMMKKLLTTDGNDCIQIYFWPIKVLLFADIIIMSDFEN